jgi:hypothetical protein
VKPVYERQDVARLAAETALAPWKDQIASAALQSARVKLVPPPSNGVASRLGGAPALPPDFE